MADLTNDKSELYNSLGQALDASIEAAQFSGQPRVWVGGRLLGQDEYDVRNEPIYTHFTRRERILNVVRRLLRIPYQDISGWQPVLHFETPPSGTVVAAYETEYGGMDSSINPPKE